MSEVAPVVLGIDGSPADEAVLRWGIEQARSRNVALRLVSAYLWALYYPWEIAYKDVQVPELAEAHREADGLLRRTSKRVAAAHPDLDLQVAALEGSPVEILLEESHRAAMMVLGSRQRATLGSVLLGSVAATVSARAGCPVVVIRGPESEPGPDSQVIVGVDGAGGSESVLEFALDHAGRNRLPVTALLCWRGDRLAITRRPAGPSSTDRAQQWLNETMAGWAAKHPEVPVRAAVIRDHPVAGLVANSIGQSLLVVGTHGRHALAGTLLGSVSQGVLHHARCPVAVVPSHRG